MTPGTLALARLPWLPSGSPARADDNSMGPGETEVHAEMRACHEQHPERSALDCEHPALDAYRPAEEEADRLYPDLAAALVVCGKHYKTDPNTWWCTILGLRRVKQ
jgi:hypothetical protein